MTHVLWNNEVIRIKKKKKKKKKKVNIYKLRKHKIFIY